MKEERENVPLTGYKNRIQANYNAAIFILNANSKSLSNSFFNSWSFKVAMICIIFSAFALFNIYTRLNIPDLLVIRDPSFYWVRTLEFVASLESLTWVEVVQKVWDSFGQNHTMLPIIIPSFAFWVLDLSTSMHFSIVVLFAYKLPALIGVLFLIKTLFKAKGVAELAQFTFILLVFSTFLIVTVFPTMPDSGGILFLSLACLVGIQTLEAIDKDISKYNLARLTVGVFLFLSLSFASVIFRRWYGFCAVSLVFAISIYFAVKVFRRPKIDWWKLFAAGALGAILFFIIFGSVIFAKVTASGGTGILSGGFDAYKMGYLQAFRGAKAPAMTFSLILSIMGALLISFQWRRHINVIVIYWTFLIGIGFLLSIQRMGLHHYALVIIPCCVGGSALIYMIGRLSDLYRQSVLGVLIITCFGAFCYIYISTSKPNQGQIHKMQAVNQELRSVFLEYAPSNKGYCVVSSREMPRSTLENLWQITNDTHFNQWPYPVPLPETNNGNEKKYQFGFLRRCKILFTLNYLTLTSAAKHHLIISYIHNQIVNQKGPLGVLFEQVGRRNVGLTSDVLVFQRKEKFTSNTESIQSDFKKWIEISPIVNCLNPRSKSTDENSICFPYIQ